VAIERDRLAGEKSRITGTLSWRLMAPARAAGAAVPARLRRAAVNAARLAGWSATLRLRGRLRQRAARRLDLHLLAASPLFDPGWYRARYADVAATGADPLVHYLLRGGAEGRSPSAAFDAGWYLSRNPDLAAAGVNPLLHYLRFGAVEGREIRPVAEERPVPPAPPRAVPAAAPPAPPVLAAPALLPPPTSPAPEAISPVAGPRMVFIAGEPDTPGAIYRITRMARAAERNGARTLCVGLAEAAARRDLIRAADIVVLWRAAWDTEVIAVVEAARQSNAKLVFDLDDLMIDPELATVAVIDGIRTQEIPEAAVRDHYTRVRDTMAHADFCIATTDELARHMRIHGKPTFVVPNGFDAATLLASRRALRARRQSPGDGLLRIGYALGSRTHHRDFAQAAEAVGRILRERPDCRLVLFNSHIDFKPLIDVAEFPALAGLDSRIEWRWTVPLDQLPDELVRFDINLVPLEVGNPFCEAKSELKHFEAALVEACTVASPTGPFRRAIAHGRTGFLAATPDDWYVALRSLVDDAGLRERMGHAAYLSALWTFGPERRADMMASVLAQVGGGPAAARAFALDVHRRLAPHPLPVVPDSAVVFAADTLGEAEVTVIVPLHNYAQHIEEALESVRSQSLAALDLVVVDDCSTDDSLAVARAWITRHAARFTRVLLVRTLANAGLGPTRNVGFAHAETPYVLPLDADNRLLPACCETLLGAARSSGAAFVYPVIRKFGDVNELIGTVPYAPARLIGVPYIDAMALVSLAAWAGVGGYCESRLGWEDYEFWCRMAEAGLNGHNVEHTELAQYRVHRGSMLQTVTETAAHKAQVMADITARHPWLALVYDAPDAAGG
jgi:glycosyltransferase involved in cell wall biosynthesis